MKYKFTPVVITHKPGFISGEFIVLHPESKKVPCIFLDQQFSTDTCEISLKKKNLLLEYPELKILEQANILKCAA